MMYRAYLILVAFFLAFVRSKAETAFSESLKDVKTQLYRLISSDERQEYSQHFNSLIDYSLGFNFEEFYFDLQNGKHDNRTCHLCNDYVNYAKSLIKDPQIIKVWAKSYCKIQKLNTEKVCYAGLEHLAEPVVYIVQNTKLNSAEMCSVVLHPDCMLYLNKAITKNVLWEVSLPNKKQFKPLSANLKPLKMVHISDFHLDLLYTPSSISKCTEPVCCRATSQAASNEHKSSAGFWSEANFTCDAPTQLIDSTLRHITNIHKDIDFLIWTGDNVVHDFWSLSKESNLKHIKTVSALVKSYFKNIPVFASLGNHDTHPPNLYIPSDVPKETNLTMKWLYDTLSDDYWTQWINTESAKKSFKKGGYYSGLVNKGLKVIVLNDGIGDKRSYWITHSSIDPDQQIQWLIQELDECETNGRYAIIIGHYPPSFCYLSWAHNYFRIVERYRDVIAGTYFGHTHQDEIVVLHNKNNTSNETYPVSVGFIAPSITTYVHYNPGYRVFSLDKFGKPLDFNMFYTDIIKDNKRGPKVEPDWILGLSAKEDYGVTDMSPESWDHFISRAQTDDKLAESYYNNYHRYSQVFVDNNNNSIGFKRQIILNRRVVDPIYSILKNDLEL